MLVVGRGLRRRRPRLPEDTDPRPGLLPPGTHDLPRQRADEIQARGAGAAAAAELHLADRPRSAFSDNPRCLQCF